MLAIVAIIVVSCNENEELDDFYSLDVTSRTPITKSSMADYEPGASQTIGGSTTSPYTVPENEDECMLYAIISIAAGTSLLLIENLTVVAATRKVQRQSVVRIHGHTSLQLCKEYGYRSGLDSV